MQCAVLQKFVNVGELQKNLILKTFRLSQRTSSLFFKAWPNVHASSSKLSFAANGLQLSARKFHAVSSEAAVIMANRGQVLTKPRTTTNTSVFSSSSLTGSNTVNVSSAMKPTLNGSRVMVKDNAAMNTTRRELNGEASSDARVQNSTASAASAALNTTTNNNNNNKQPLYVFSGPSGSGKSTLIKQLMSKQPELYAFSVSHTTRQPRPGERHGVDYHYVDKPTIDRMIANGEFVESAQFSGNTYGTSVRAIQDVVSTGRVCLLDVDMQGVKNVKQAKLPARFIFIKPPSVEELERRLRGRKTENEETLQKRLSAAKAELTYADSEPAAYDFVVVNDSLDEAYKKLESYMAEETQQQQQQQQQQQSQSKSSKQQAAAEANAAAEKNAPAAMNMLKHA